MTQFQMSQKHYKVYCILKKLTALCCSKFRFTADSLSLVSFFFHHPSFSNTCTFICAHTTHLLSLYNEITQPSSPNSWLGPCSALKPRVCHPRSLLVEQQEKNIKIGTFPPSFPAWIPFLNLALPLLVRNSCLAPQATSCPANLIFNQSLNSVLASWTHKAIRLCYS